MAEPKLEAATPQSQVSTLYRPSVLMPPLLLGMFLRALQMTVIGPSLVNIAQSLGSTLADVGWIMAIYATGSLIAQPIAGRMSDARGRRAVFIAALVVFTAGSLVCALSTSLGWLIVGRVIQSLGAGGVQPAAIALVGQRAPKERLALFSVESSSMAGRRLARRPLWPAPCGTSLRSFHGTSFFGSTFRSRL
jgi:MFS family permease